MPVQQLEHVSPHIRQKVERIIADSIRSSNHKDAVGKYRKNMNLAKDAIRQGNNGDALEHAREAYLEALSAANTSWRGVLVNGPVSIYRHEGAYKPKSFLSRHRYYKAQRLYRETLELQRK